jgi:hypothetical protein
LWCLERLCAGGSVWNKQILALLMEMTGKERATTVVGKSYYDDKYRDPSPSAALRVRMTSFVVARRDER